MGSIIELNDTLQITKEQGFPEVLDIDRHLEKPIKLEDLEKKIFEFRDKPKLRFYQVKPIRVFLVQNIGGKWLYWGKCHILEVRLDYERQVTSGKFEIVEIFTPKEMSQAYKLIDGDDGKEYVF